MNWTHELGLPAQLGELPRAAEWTGLSIYSAAGPELHEDIGCPWWRQLAAHTSLDFMLRATSASHNHARFGMVE